MKFIKSDDEEGLDVLAQKSPRMKKAIGVLKELSADERTRMLYEKQEMARMDAEAIVRAEFRGVIAEKDAALAEKDALIAAKDAALTDKDAALADKVALIAELRARLGEGE